MEGNDLTVVNSEDNAVINKLRKENETLKERIEELEQIIMKNQRLVDSAKKYRTEHNKMMENLKKLKLNYEQATADINLLKKTYKLEMEGLLKAIRENA